MGLQEEFDKLYDFNTAVDPALLQVEENWRLAVDGEVAALVALPVDEWAAHLDGVTYDFADDHLPVGLTAEAEAAWFERCDAVRYKALRFILQLAQTVQTRSAQADLHVASANALLQSAKTAYLAGDTWAPGWVLELVVGVWHGIRAGGSDAFSEAADRTLFDTAKAFLVANAARALEVFDLARESWPSDAVGVSEYRDARAALAAFVAP